MANEVTVLPQPTREQLEVARKVVEKWYTGLSFASKEYVGNHDCAVLRDDIAYAIMRRDLAGSR